MMPNGVGSSDPSTGNPDADLLARIRDFIRDMWQLESVGDRDANSRFDRNEWTDIDFVGNDTVYGNGNSFWFDQNGNGTVETQFWMYPDGTVWCDLNNDGNPDTLIQTIVDFP